MDKESRAHQCCGATSDVLLQNRYHLSSTVELLIAEASASRAGSRH